MGAVAMRSSSCAWARWKNPTSSRPTCTSSPRRSSRGSSCPWEHLPCRSTTAARSSGPRRVSSGARRSLADSDSHEPPEHVPLLKRLGPGLVTGAADDDPSGIATYSQAGAQYGYGLLWTVLLTTPLMVG